MIILNSTETIQLFDSMYPCEVIRISTSTDTTKLHVLNYVTCYGYIMSGTVIATLNRLDIRKIESGQYFCLTGSELMIEILKDTEVVFFNRHGFKGQNQIGGPIEKTGRLTYINGCTDSLLVYPPRLGDPSLNHLHFPTEIDQSFHIHPSLRLGIVVRGQGIADVKTQGKIESKELILGTVFVLNEKEEHRFRTIDSEMDVIAFHPDGDWGPTDHNHSMINRTYISNS